MKKKIIGLFIVVLISSLFFVFTIGKSTFKGTIIKINGDTAIVDWERGRTFVDLSVNRAVTFQVGDEIEVGYYGEIKESYPSQVNTLSVKLVE